ncbi:MAG: M28 family metallopeptidase [Planctomycetota bacterium]
MHPSLLCALLPVLSLASSPSSWAQEGLSSPAVSARDIGTHIEALASDAFGGRGPGTDGEARAVRYIVDRFSDYGLEPGAGDGWLQQVPMIELTPTGAPDAGFDVGGRSLEILSGRDVMLWSPVTEGAIAVEASEVVFCGHGIVAPEYGWDDYAGVDVRGKTAVVLVNDPGFRRPDQGLFRGNAMTYYGRWTYKFEEAERQGAAACLIVHEDAAAGYGWTVVAQSWGRPQLQLESGREEPVTRVRGWVSLDAAMTLFEQAGQDLAALARAAAEPGAKPVPLTGATFRAAFENRVARTVSPNVIGRVTGSTHPDEVVLVTAHWDHLGTRPGAPEEDNVYNGAVDNASGTALMLELAEAAAAMDPPPARSIVFVATTAEEKGLLGSKHYAQNPSYPLARTVCGLNVDVANTLGPMEDIVVVGFGASELDADLRVVAAAQGRRVVPEATPEKGFYFRSDHFSLAKVGVPMLYTNTGTTSVDRGAEWVAKQKRDFERKRYHRVRDEFDAEWDLEGAAEDGRLFLALLTLWSNDARWRAWAPDSEFRAAREASLAAAKK